MGLVETAWDHATAHFWHDAHDNFACVPSFRAPGLRGHAPFLFLSLPRFFFLGGGGWGRPPCFPCFPFARKEAHWNWKVHRPEITEAIIARQGRSGKELRPGVEREVEVARRVSLRDALIRVARSRSLLTPKTHFPYPGNRRLLLVSRCYHGTWALGWWKAGPGGSMRDGRLFCFLASWPLHGVKRASKVQWPPDHPHVFWRVLQLDPIRVGRDKQKQGRTCTGRGARLPVAALRT